MKQHEPGEFTQWKALENDNWKPTFENLSGSVKQAVKHALMHEHGYICCYCEQRVDDDNSHIEHFRPRSDPGVDPLDFANMLCSCQNRLSRKVPRHCGSLKGDWFDEYLTVSPFAYDCEQRFNYTGDGRILPADPSDEAATTTITKLGLDIPKLNDMRKKVIEPFLDPAIDDDEMRKFVVGYLAIDGSGYYNAFWTTIRYLFGSYAHQEQTKATYPD